MKEIKQKRLYFVYFKFYLYEILEKEDYNDRKQITGCQEMEWQREILEHSGNFQGDRSILQSVP